LHEFLLYRHNLRNPRLPFFQPRITQITRIFSFFDAVFKPEALLVDVAVQEEVMPLPDARGNPKIRVIRD